MPTTETQLIRVLASHNLAMELRDGVLHVNDIFTDRRGVRHDNWIPFGDMNLAGLFRWLEY